MLPFFLIQEIVQSLSISAPNTAPASHSWQHWLSGCSSTQSGDAAQIQNLDQQFLQGQAIAEFLIATPSYSLLSKSSVFPPDSLGVLQFSPKALQPLTAAVLIMSCVTRVHNRTKTCFKVPSRGRFFNWVCPLSCCSGNTYTVRQLQLGCWAFKIQVHSPCLCFSFHVSLFPLLNPLANCHAKIQDRKQHLVQYLLSKATILYHADYKCTEKIAVCCFCCFVPVTPTTRL